MYYKLRKIGKKTGRGTVYVVYRFGQSELAKTTGVNVLPSEFNPKTGKVNGKNSLFPELNAQIQAVAGRMERAVRNARGEGLLPTTATVEACYAKLISVDDELPDLQDGAEVAADDLQRQMNELRTQLARKEAAYADMLLAAGLSNGPNAKALFTDKIADFLATRPNYRPATILGYRDLSSMVAKFHSSLQLADVNVEFLQDFQRHLLDKEMRNQSVRTILDRLRTVYTHFAEDEGLSLLIFRKFRPIPALANDNVIYLTPEEIDAIAALEIKAPTLRQVQQQFLFACETGLRHSDLYITAANVVGEELRVTTRKKQKTVTVPLTERAKAIIEGPCFPFKPVNVNHYNKAIQQVCKKAPVLNALVTVTHYSGAKTFVQTRMKWQMISSHVARKSAINNWLAKGVRETVVADWAGHSDLKMLQRHYQNRASASRQEASKIR
ncbi:site-specific integrase [Hymenobacter agri]